MDVMRRSASAVLAGCLVAGCPVLLRAQQPVVAAQPQARLTMDVERAFAEIDRVSMLAAYDAHAKKNPAWDEAAKAFMVAVPKYYAMYRGVNHSDLANQAKKLRELGCDDLGVRVFLAMVEFEGCKGDAAISACRDELRAARSALAPGALPAHREAHTFDVEWRMSSALRDNAGTARAMQGAVPVVLRGFSDPSLSADAQRLLFRQVGGRIMMEAPPEVLKAYEDAIVAREGLLPWGRSMLLGAIEYNRAWSARGEGVASTVTPEGWAGFKAHGGRAATHFLDAYGVDPGRPEAATMMIRLAMAGLDPTKQTALTWCERATSAQLDHEVAFKAAIWALRPRWGGSHEEMLEFGRRYAAVKRYDTMVPNQMIIAVLAVIDDTGDLRAPFRFDNVYEPLSGVLSGYLKQATDAPNPTGVRQIRSMQAAAARLAGEYADGRAALDAIENRLDSEGHRGFRDPVWLSNECYAFSSAGAELLRGAVEAAENGDFAEAVALAAKAVEACDAQKDPRGRKALAAYHDAIKTRGAVEQGWTNLAGDSLAGLWHQSRPGWTQTESGWRVKPGDAPEYALFPLAMPERFDFEATVEFERDIDAGCAGLVFQWEWAQEPQARWRALTISRGEPVARVSNEFALDSKGSPVTAAKTYKLSVMVWDGEVVAKVNGKQVFRGSPPEHVHWRPGARIGLGTAGSPGALEFSNVRVRVPTQAPKP